MSNGKQTLRRRPDKADKQPKLHEALHDYLTYPYTLEYYSPWDNVPHEWMPWIEEEDFYFNDADEWYFDEELCDEVYLPGCNCWEEYIGSRCQKCRSSNINGMQWQYSSVTLKGKQCKDCGHEFASIEQQEHNKEASKNFTKERLDTESISHYSGLNYDYYAYENY